MKARWNTVKLTDVAELSGRIGWKGLTAKEYTEEGPFFLSVHSLNHGDFVDFRAAFHISQARYDESPEIMLQSGDVLICKDGAGIGKVGIVGELPGQTTINSSLLLIRSKPKIEPKYLYYILMSPYFQAIVQSRLEGATTPHLYQRDIAGFPIHLPPLDEQRRIVAVLDKAFANIATATANAQKNLTNARALFEGYAHSTFANLVETEPPVSLKRLTQLITKGSSPKWQGIAYVDEPGVLFVTSENVGSYELKLDRPKYVELEFNRKDRKSILQNGDVLTNIVGASIGRTAIYNIDELANINQAVCLIRCNNDALFNRYLTHLLNCPQFLEILHSNEVNSARANLSLGFFSQLEIPCPSLHIQTQIADRLDEFREEVIKLIDLQNLKLAALAELKQSLLQKAFAGELT